METLEQRIRTKRIDSTCAMSIVKAAVSFAKPAPDPHAAAVTILQRVSADATLPPATAAKLIAMLETELVHELVDLCSARKPTGWCCIDAFRVVQ